jgi:hypothetical protein
VWRLVVLGLAVVAGAILGARADRADALAGASRDEVRAPPRGECPGGASRDEAREARIVAALLATREGAALVARAQPLGAMCFGAARGITPDGTLLAPARAPDAEAAAYVGHLLVHRAEGTPGAPPRDRASCGAWLRDARAAEERAAAVEERLARALGATYGGPDVDARLAEYAARCEREAR